jgi:signal transduction histidine kinase
MKNWVVYSFLQRLVVQLALVACMLCMMCVTAAGQASPEQPQIINNTGDTAAIRRLIASGEKIVATMPNSDQALLKFRKAFYESRRANYADGVALSLYQMGRIYKEKGMYDTAIKHFRLGLYYIPAVTDKNIPGKLLNGVGTCYFLKTDYRLASAYFYKTLEEIRQKRLTDPYFITLLYSNFGYLWIQLNDSAQALQYLTLAEKVAIASGEKRTLTNIYCNLGNYYYSFGQDLAKVLQYNRLALKLARENNDLRAEQIAIHNLGSVLLYQGQPAEALSYFRDALDLKTHSDPYTSAIGEYFSLGYAYLLLKDYKQAEKNASICLAKAKETGLREYIAKSYELLHLIYAETHQYKDAYKFSTLFIQMHDSIISTEKSRAIREMEIKYRTSEKDRDIMQKKLLISRQENNLRNKNIWIAFISVGLLLTIISLASLFRRHKHKQRLQQQQIRILKQEQEIGSLKAMMQGVEKERSRIARELHDGIGGMLAAIRMNLGVLKQEDYASPGKIDEIMHMVVDTATEVRKTAHNLMPDILDKHELPEALVIYCEHISKSNELEIELQFHGDMEPLSKNVQLMLYRIFQELIQNVVKHSGATYAAIQMVQHNRTLSIFIEDNGTGFSPNNVVEGLGLENLRYRVQSLHGELSITSEKGKHTTVYMEFDLDKLKYEAVV